MGHEVLKNLPNEAGCKEVKALLVKYLSEFDWKEKLRRNLSTIKWETRILKKSQAMLFTWLN